MNERKIAKFFNLNDDNWMRHANPWSVYSRYTVLLLLILAFWSRSYIGWMAAFPVILSLVWLFLNPILFKRPASTRNWASRAVLGERVYLNRNKVDIPTHHRTNLIPLLNIISGVGMLLCIWAMQSYSVIGAIGGVMLAYLGKSWYLDRMVWIYLEMKERDPSYQKWDY